MNTQQIIDIICKYFATQPIEKAWLFGSFARGEQGPDSDVDIMVVFDKDGKVGLFKYAHIMNELQEIVGRKVDLVVDGSLLPFAEETANRDRILIYERAS